MLEVIELLAGRGGRMPELEFTLLMATAFVIGAPGIRRVEFTENMAGRDGRNDWLEFIEELATA
jgi:hypothetical protein